LINCRRRHFPLGHTGLCGQLYLSGKNTLHRILGKEDRLKQILFGDELSLTLNHEDGIFAGSNNDLHIALLQFFSTGVSDQPAGNATHLDAGYGAFKGDIGDHQCGGSADHGKNRRIVILFGGDDRGHHLGVAQIPFREEGTDWPVNKTADQGLVF